MKNQKLEHTPSCSKTRELSARDSSVLDAPLRSAVLLGCLLFGGPLPIPRTTQQVGSFPELISSFFGIQETYISHGFQLTIKLGEQEHRGKVYVRPALLQRRGLDDSDLFSTISGWPSPSFSPSSLCRACCCLGTAAWRSCLRTPFPLLGSPNQASWSLGCTPLMIKVSRGRGSRSAGRGRRKGSKKAGAFARTFCALQLRASHSNSWASISSPVKWV